ncbi:MAG: hypothetical protein WBB67_08665 [bacterium]
MKRGILIGLVAWIFGVICGYFLFVVVAGALSHNGRTISPGEEHVQDKSDPVAIYAKDSILIYEVAPEMVKATFGTKKAHIEYKIKNIGNKVLDNVKMKIYLLDNQGKAIYEEEHSAIWTSDVFSDAPGPLKPNYIRGRSTFIPNALGVEECPSEWAVGKVKLQITEIEFDN